MKATADDKAYSRLPKLLVLAVVTGGLAAAVMVLDAVGTGGAAASPWLAVALTVVALLATVVAFAANARAAGVRREAAQQARQNERNQEAILRLLDELGSLADGDLTVQATVTEDITGAIADSINYAIEAL